VHAPRLGRANRARELARPEREVGSGQRLEPCSLEPGLISQRRQVIEPRAVASAEVASAEVASAGPVIGPVRLPVVRRGQVRHGSALARVDRAPVEPETRAAGEEQGPDQERAHHLPRIPLPSTAAGV
jgi:hypothetical protein